MRPSKLRLPAQHRDHHQVVCFDLPRHFRRQRTRVPDAGGAAVAHDVEPQGVEIRRQPRAPVVLGDHARARRQRRLHPLGHAQPALHRFLRQQPGRHHHAWVRGVGAAGDGGDHDGAIAHAPGSGGIDRGRRHGGSAGRPAFAAHDLQRRLHRRRRRTLQPRQRRQPRRFRRRERDAVMRTLGPGQARLNPAEVEFQPVAVLGLRRVLVVEQALLLAVRLDQRNLLRRAPGHAQEIERFLVNGKNAAGRAVLRRHVPDGRAVRQRQLAQPFAEELDELPHHAFLAQHLGDGEDQVGRGRAFAQCAGQPEARRHSGMQHRHRLPQHRRFRLDPAHAPAQHPQPVDHRGVRVGPHQGVGIRLHRPALPVTGEDHARQVLQVHLVHDPRVRRHDSEVAERRLSPAQERIALLVALEFEVGVDEEGIGRAVGIHLHRVVDHQLHRLQRVDERRVAPQRRHGVAHRRQVHHRGHPGEVLQQHPRRRKRNLFRRRLLGVPAGEKFDLRRRHRAPILVAQQVFQQDAQRVRQPAQVVAFLLQRVQAENFECPLPDA